MNSSDSGSSATSAGPSASAPQPTLLFFLPPPPTVWVQFGDGVQLGFTPSPAAYLSSLFGGAAPFPAGVNPANGASDPMMRALHDLFVRAQQQQHGPPPTSKHFLDHLPVKTWTADMTASEKHCECAICLCDYEKDDKVMTLPCGHAFHKDCGTPWLVEHNVCPTCRYQLPTQQSEDQQATQTAETQTQTQTEPEPEHEHEPDHEPEAESDAENRTTGVRRPRAPSTSVPERVVRQRVDESVSASLPGAVAEDDMDLDSMLEEEASRFVEDERRQLRPADSAVFDDVDVEELLHDTQSAN